MEPVSKVAEPEDDAIRTHAERLTAYMALRSLVAKWRSEFAAQDEANRAVAWSLSVLAAFFLVGACIYAGYTWWNAGRIVDLSPAPSLRARSPAIEAYEKTWWTAVQRDFATMCAQFDRSMNGRYSFMTWVNGDGQIVRVATNGTGGQDIEAQLKKVLHDMSFSSFPPEIRAERKTLGLRGYLFVSNGKCSVQRW